MLAGERSLLVDCGLSAREALRLIRQAGHNPATLGGILLTHEHADHARGAPALAQQLGIPVLATRGTLAALPRDSFEHVPLQMGHPHSEEEFTIVPFPVSHDAAEPAGYRIEAHGRSLGLLTDAGEVTTSVVDGLRGCHHMVVESNHDPDLLTKGPYPQPLKRRIRSRYGHLSNDDCGRLLGRVLSPHTQRVVLGHLSRTNNTPELALATNHALLRSQGVLAPPMVVAPPVGPLGPFAF